MIDASMFPAWAVAGVGLLTGVLVSAWNKVKSVLWRVAGLVVHKVDVTAMATDVVLPYMQHRFVRWQGYDPTYGFVWQMRRDRGIGVVAFEAIGRKPMIMWDGWKPIYVTEFTDGSQGKPACQIIYLRGTFNFAQFCIDAANYHTDRTTAHNKRQAGATNKRFAVIRVPAGGGGGAQQKPQANRPDKRIETLPWWEMGTQQPLGYTALDLGLPVPPGRAIDGLVFPPYVTKVIGEFTRWLDSEKWYKERALTWKRGWLLYGPPGVGKTALVRAMAQDHDMPVFVFDLASMSNSQLQSAWKDVESATPCIVLMEDIDNVFHGRENITQKGRPAPIMLNMPRPERKPGGTDSTPGDATTNNDDDYGRNFGGFSQTLTFDALLNCLDGVERNDGVFVVITTNDPSKIDSALGAPRLAADGTMELISTRPGRIDKAVELTYMTMESRLELARRLLGEYPDVLATAQAEIKAAPDAQETPAQCQERYAQLALATYWERMPKDDAAVTPLDAGTLVEKRVEKLNGKLVEITMPLESTNGYHESTNLVGAGR